MNHIIKIVQYENINLNAGLTGQNGESLPEAIFKKKTKTFYSGIDLSSPITGSSIKDAIKMKNSYNDIIEESLKLGDNIISDSDIISFGIGTVVYEITLPSLNRVIDPGLMKYSSRAKALFNSNKAFLDSKWSPLLGVTGATGIIGATGLTGATGLKSMKVKNKNNKSGPTGPIKVTTINPSPTGPTGATA
jgi:hypothetical protein